jgi:hypothetical protein
MTMEEQEKLEQEQFNTGPMQVCARVASIWLRFSTLVLLVSHGFFGRIAADPSVGLNMLVCAAS